MAFIRKRVALEGFKELNDDLGEFSKSTSGNILKRAVSAAGAMIAEEAAARAPVDKSSTGPHLKDQIKVSKAKIISPGKAAFAKAMQETGDRAIAAQAARQANRESGGTGRHAVCQVGPTRAAFYGQFQEFGTAHHKPQPFMRPAWDANDERALEVMRETLGTEIEKTRTRIRKKNARLIAGGN